jgi:hypothetical protein
MASPTVAKKIRTQIGLAENGQKEKVRQKGRTFGENIKTPPSCLFVQTVPSAGARKKPFLTADVVQNRVADHSITKCFLAR